MTIDKIGKLITLHELYMLFNKELMCITFNLTTNQEELLTYQTHSNIPCLIALRMSSNLPFVFDDFKYMDNYYTDGGFCNNFPINIGDKIGTKILGIVIYDLNFVYDTTYLNILENLYYLMCIPLLQQMKINITNVSTKCKIVKLTSTHAISFINFHINTSIKLEMFSDGYVQMKTIFQP